MPARRWSFWMPPEDHRFIRWCLSRYRARLTPKGRVFTFAIAFGILMSTPGVLVAAYLVPSFALGTLFTAWFLGWFQRLEVEAHRELPPPPSAGDVLRYRVRLRNTGGRSIRALAVLEATLPFGLYLEPSEKGGVGRIQVLGPGEEETVELAVRCSGRGAYDLESLLVVSSFPSGLGGRPVRAAAARTLMVYPRFVTQHEFELPVGRRYQPGGIAVSSGVGDSTEFLGTREWREGDRLRDLHWPSYARSGRLIVKEYREEYFVRIGLLLDTELGKRQRTEVFEKRISLAAGIADALARRDYIIDLFAAGESFHHFQAGRALARLENLLELLSCVEPTGVVRFEAVESALLPCARQLSSVVLLLADWDEPRARLCQRIRESGAGIRALVVREKPSTRPLEPGVVLVSPIVEISFFAEEGLLARSKRQRVELLMGSLSSFLVYGVCQKDFGLPLVASLLVLGAARFVDAKDADTEGRGGVWLWIGGVVCLLVGLVWRRTFTIHVPGSVPAIPVIQEGLQAGSVVVACVLWLLWGRVRNASRLVEYAAWTTVALSMNVPVTSDVVGVFGLFCFLQLAFLVASWFPSAKASALRPLSWIGTFAVAAIVVSIGTVVGVDELDRAALKMFQESVLPASLTMPGGQGILRLGGPGPSGRSRRAVMEIERDNEVFLHLRTAVYEKFKKRSWRPAPASSMTELPPPIGPNLNVKRLTLYNAVQKVIPSPLSTVAATAGTRKDGAGLLYSVRRRSSRPFVLASKGDSKPVTLGSDERRRNLDVPESLRPVLEETLREIIDAGVPPLKSAREVQAFFQGEFTYSLDVNLPAGEEGVRVFLTERGPAYCTYFASAMTLLMRVHGVPARVVGGYLASETEGLGRGRFVVRIRDAHAWTEVFLPSESETLERLSSSVAPIRGSWVRFDPTPPASRLDAMDSSGGLYFAFDSALRTLTRLWIGLRSLSLGSLLSAAWPFVLLIVFVGLLVRWWRRRPPAPHLPQDTVSSDPQQTALLALAKRFDSAVLACFNVPRAECQTDGEFLDALHETAVQDASLVRPVEEFIDAYSAIRYGPGPLSSEKKQFLESLVLRLEAASMQMARSSTITES